LADPHAVGGVTHVDDLKAAAAIGQKSVAAGYRDPGGLPAGIETDDEHTVGRIADIDDVQPCGINREIGQVPGNHYVIGSASGLTRSHQNAVSGIAHIIHSQTWLE